jgi:uncharacterized MAPEG superfamily protein
MKKYYNFFNYSSLIFIAIIVLLVTFDIIHGEPAKYVLIFAILLLILRIVFRIIFIIQNKKNKVGGSFRAP